MYKQFFLVLLTAALALVACTVNMESVRGSGTVASEARRLATLELNALVEGALQGGATEVVAWDRHGNFPGGLDVELLHPGCKLVMGAGDGGPAGLDESLGVCSNQAFTLWRVLRAR